MSRDNLFIQKSYADELASRISTFTKKRDTPYLANFRCEVCGDSQKRKQVKRGFIFTSDKGDLMYYCQNCNYNVPFTLFLEQYHSDLYRQYLFEILGTKQTSRSTAIDLATRQVYEPSYRGLTPIQELQPNHPCIQYLKSRKLPADRCKRLFYTDKFCSYVNNIIPDKFDMTRVKEHGRLVFPLLTKEGEMFGVIGRTIDPKNTLRYLTLKFNENYPKIFGLESVNFEKHIYVLEGPIDSFFINNSVALAGTDADISLIIRNKNMYTVILDNQPRNSQVVKKYRKYIDDGNNIVIWPNGLPGKDINDLILAGFSPDKIKNIISEHTFSGVLATVRFNDWRKV